MSHPSIRTFPLKCYMDLRGTQANPRTLTSTAARGARPSYLETLVSSGKLSQLPTSSSAAGPVLHSLLPPCCFCPSSTSVLVLLQSPSYVPLTSAQATVDQVLADSLC